MRTWSKNKIHNVHVGLEACIECLKAEIVNVEEHDMI